MKTIDLTVNGQVEIMGQGQILTVENMIVDTLNKSPLTMPEFMRMTKLVVRVEKATDEEKKAFAIDDQDWDTFKKYFANITLPLVYRSAIQVFEEIEK